MGLLQYTKSLVFPNVNQLPASELIHRLKSVFSVKRIGAMRLTSQGLDFDNLYLKRLDLLPVPKGWIKVHQDHDGLKVTFGVDYRWRVNRRGRQMALVAAMIMLAVSIFQFLNYEGMDGRLIFAWVVLLIPANLYLLWLFVFGLNSLYARLYMTRLINRVLTKA